MFRFKEKGQKCDFFFSGRFSSRNQRVSVPERIDIGRPEHRVERRVITSGRDACRRGPFYTSPRRLPNGEGWRGSDHDVEAR